MDTERKEPKKRAGDSRSQPFELSDAGDGSSSETGCRRPDEAPSQNCLRHLRYDKDFLWKVFGYLVEDGLHECRRVCRRWREVCSEFFTKHICIRWENLADAHLKFPNADSLSTLVPRMCSQNAWSNIRLSLTGIRSLEIDTRFLFHCRQFDVFPQRQRERFASVQLESIVLERFDECTYSPISLMAAHLTNLTHLKIGPETKSSWNTKPLSGVYKLESLSLYARHLFTQEGSLTFPSLTNLTRLEVMYDDESDVVILEVWDIT